MFSRISFSSIEADGGKKKERRELKVLFVSKRDSCRGPMAECIFIYLAEMYNKKSFARFIWRASSAGLMKHNQGNLPEQLCLRVLAENHLETMHGCRQVRFLYSRTALRSTSSLSSTSLSFNCNLLIFASLYFLFIASTL